jgi:uncharacterized 2Fe-2S/4Fe-4S cluster protein (DUF4445 family)
MSNLREMALGDIVDWEEHLIKRWVTAERAHQELVFDYQLLQQSQESRLSTLLTAVHISWAKEREELQRKINQLESDLRTANRIKDAFSAGHGILLSG